MILAGRRRSRSMREIAAVVKVGVSIAPTGTLNLNAVKNNDS